MNLNIELTGQDSLVLTFKLLDTPLTELWLERMSIRNQYPLDDPERFYGFNPIEHEMARAEQIMRQCIEIINAYEVIITNPFTNVYDQECLNYMHSIFERYHGQLEQQHHEYWNRAPIEVRKALADLNIGVHRCETVARRGRPRFVCTWFGLPKTKCMPIDMMQAHGEFAPAWGSVCINYAEIGKTLLDFATDNDNYIEADAMFQPYNHYSADFNVRFFENTPEEIKQRVGQCKEYYNTHLEFFQKKGYTKFHDPRLLPLQFPVAHLIETMPREQLLKEIQQRQHVNKVYLE
jgi:hypothetical protein